MLAQQQHVLNRAGLARRHNPLLQSISISVRNQPEIDDEASIHEEKQVLSCEFSVLSKPTRSVRSFFT
jgi:hypothetical protein